MVLPHSMRKGTRPAGTPCSTSSLAAVAWLMIPIPFSRNIIDTRTPERVSTIAEENSFSTPEMHGRNRKLHIRRLLLKFEFTDNVS